MSGPSFTRGVLVALALAFVSSVAMTVLSGAFAFQDLIRILVPGLSIAYLISISPYRYRRSGWASCLVLWGGFALFLWLVWLPLIEYVVLHVVALSLLRAVFFHKNLLSVVLDLMLSVFGLAAAFWAASHTGSVFLAIWCFFLSQAAFVVIPGNGSAADASNGNRSNSSEFDVARRKAEEALRKIAST